MRHLALIARLAALLSLLLPAQAHAQAWEVYVPEPVPVEFNDAIVGNAGRSIMIAVTCAQGEPVLALDLYRRPNSVAFDALEEWQRSFTALLGRNPALRISIEGPSPRSFTVPRRDGGFSHSLSAADLASLRTATRILVTGQRLRETFSGASSARALNAIGCP
jgi:hypothetical protein